MTVLAEESGQHVRDARAGQTTMRFVPAVCNAPGCLLAVGHEGTHQDANGTDW